MNPLKGLYKVYFLIGKQPNINIYYAKLLFMVYEQSRLFYEVSIFYVEMNLQNDISMIVRIRIILLDFGHKGFALTVTQIWTHLPQDWF
jgi:hypothetical protein